MSKGTHGLVEARMPVSDPWLPHKLQRRGARGSHVVRCGCGREACNTCLAEVQRAIACFACRAIFDQLCILIRSVWCVLRTRVV